MVIHDKCGDTDTGELRIAETEPTKWGALNAVTAWIDQFARPERNYAFATFGQGAKIKARDFQLLTAK